MSVSAAESEKILRTLSERVLAIIRDCTGLLPELAEPIRDRIVAELRREIGGEKFYVSSRSPDRRQHAIAAIAKDFDGTSESRDRICSQLHISRRTFYRLANSVIAAIDR